MIPRTRRTHSKESGIVLLWAVFAAMAMFTTAFVMSTLAASSKRISEVNFRRTNSGYLSQGAVTLATNAVYEALSNGIDPPATGTGSIDGAQVDYTITQILGPIEEQDAAGLNQLLTTYRVEGTATWDGVESTSRQIVRGIVVPLFQFMMFYENDMEFLYPAPMYLNGRVHCNSDIYLYAQHGLDFDTNHLTIAGSLYNRPHYPEWAAKYNWGKNNPARVRRYVDNPFDGSEPFVYSDIEAKKNMDWSGIPSVSGFDSDFTGYDANGDGDFNDTWDWEPFGPRSMDKFSEPPAYTGNAGQTLRTGEHGTLPVVTPDIDDFDMFVASSVGDYVYNGVTGEYVPTAPGTGTHTKGPFFESADLAIISYPDGSWKAFDNLGVDVTSGVTSAGIVTSTSLYDARQAAGSGKYIQNTIIEVDKLNTSGYFPNNGLLYVAGYGSGTGTDVKGFQLSDGEKLKDDLSVVSPDSIYIQGDFNTDSKKSAAVMADAVNLLSNNWSGWKWPGYLPNATDTTYNAAILTGDGEATASSYNGGPHNLPRFHEKWRGDTCTINGSLVCLGNSVRATGQFEVYGDYYQAPNRNWSFDEQFNSISNLPPFTPSYVEVQNVVAW